MIKQFSQPIDRLSLTLIFVLSLIITLIIWGGKTCGNSCFLKTAPYIKEFSWQNQIISAQDKAFILTFDRPMDHLSVEENLVIKPPLPGKISWSGRRLAYTLDFPAPYGNKYQIYLQGGKERFRQNSQLGETITPFTGEFSTRDRAFAYIGSEGVEKGRLILFNLTKQTKDILTPPDLVVINFKFYPQGDHILFSAAGLGSGIDGLRSLQLYKVATQTDQQNHYPLEVVLDNYDYQNNQFDISADGQTIIVQRLARKNPSDFALWQIKGNNKPERLNIVGGEFKIAPDGKTLAVAQGEGIAILPLDKEAKPLDFMSQFGKLLSFSPDGAGAVMVDFNTNNSELRYTQSLYYVNNQGVKKLLLNLKGSIIDCQFNPQATHLYCLMTELIEAEEYQEKPYIADIDLATTTVQPLLVLPHYQDIQINIAPDGLGILFDQIITNPENNNNDSLTTNSGESIVGGYLWLLLPSSQDKSKADLKQLPLTGFKPQWLP